MEIHERRPPELGRRGARLGTRRVSSVGAAVLLLVVTGSGAAQEGTEPLRPGDRIRVWAPYAGVSGQEGRLAGATDSLLVPRSGGRLLELPIDDVHRIEVERRTGNHLGTGALVGGVTGAVLTAAFLVPFCGDSDTACEADEVIRAAGFIGLPSLVAGSGVGLLMGRHEWVETEIGPERSAPH